ncbi:MAG: Ltp family lipoprotein [Microbacterium sp.]
MSQDPNTLSYAAGWYPDTALPGTERYYDGAAWTEQSRPAAATATPPTATPKKKRKWPWIVGAAVAAVILIPAIATAGNGGSADDVADKPAAVGEAEEPAAEVAPVMVAMPAGLVGMTASDASNALAAVGLKADYDGEATAKVLSIDGAAEVEEGTTVTLIVEQPPVLTLSQENAVSKGRSYLGLMGFSRTGLIQQLAFEGYSNEDATFAADFIAPDWNTEAAEKAKSYLDTMAFSREGLYEQLAFEGFEPAQIEAGLAAVGY